MSEERRFESWLGGELRRVVAGVQAPSPRATQAAYRSVRGASVVSVPGRLVAGVAVAVLAVIAGGALAATAYTGTANPAAWGPAVVRAVSGCKDDTSSDGHRARVPEVCGAGRQRPEDRPAQPPTRLMQTPPPTPTGPVSAHDDPSWDGSVMQEPKPAGGHPSDEDSQDQSGDSGNGAGHKNGTGGTPQGDQGDTPPARKPHDPRTRAKPSKT